MKNRRTQVSEAAMARALTAVREHVKVVLQKHGKGTFASRAEALGVIQLELREYEGKVQARDREGQQHELKDIAVACIFALACENTFDW
jgi:hypothetical protein